LLEDSLLFSLAASEGFSFSFSLDFSELCSDFFSFSAAAIAAGDETEPLEANRLPEEGDREANGLETEPRG